MRYREDLTLLAEDVMAGLPTDAARWESTALLDEVWAAPESWPVPDGLELGEAFGPQCWISYVAYPDGIEVLDSKATAFTRPCSASPACTTSPSPDDTHPVDNI